MKRRTHTIRHTALLAAGVLGLTTWFAVHGSAQDRGMRAPKNLKVLKDLPPGQLIPMMRNFNASLGVRCDYCHVVTPDHTGYEKDDKPAKNTARKMILMVKDINAHQKVVKNEATCFMCHHGSAKPEVQAPMEMRPGGGGGGRRGGPGGPGGPGRGPGGGR